MDNIFMSSKIPFYLFVLKMIKVDWKDFTLFTVIYTLIVFILSSFLLMRGALLEDISRLEHASSDLTVQKISGGKTTSVPENWVDILEGVEGVTAVVERKFDHYFFAPARRYFTLVGYSTFQNHSNKDINYYLEQMSLDLDTEKGVIVGQGVRDILTKYHYDKNLPFILNDGTKVQLPIIGTFNNTSSLTTNDVVLVPNHYLDKIIGSDEDALTDVGLRISNDELKSSIARKIVERLPDARVLDMKEIFNMTNRFYNQFSGIFLALLAIPVMTFIFLIFSRAYALKRATQRQIAILRVLGWPINLILEWHLVTAFLIASISFMLGTLLAYAYIYFMNGVGMSSLFLGFGNLPEHYQFPLHYSLYILFYIALFSIPPFILASLYPAYKLGRKEAREVLQ